MKLFQTIEYSAIVEALKTADSLTEIIRENLHILFPDGKVVRGFCAQLAKDAGCDKSLVSAIVAGIGFTVANGDGTTHKRSGKRKATETATPPTPPTTETGKGTSLADMLAQACVKAIGEGVSLLTLTDMIQAAFKAIAKK